MFRPYRTLKLKVPRPCCPWCQTHSERIEQKLQAMEIQIQELSTRLATLLRTTGEAETPSGGLLTALQVFGQMFGLTSSHHRTGGNPQSEPVHLVGAFSAFIAALDRLGGRQPHQPHPTWSLRGPKLYPLINLLRFGRPKTGPNCLPHDLVLQGRTGEGKRITSPVLPVIQRNSGRWRAIACRKRHQHHQGYVKAAVKLRCKRTRQDRGWSDIIEVSLRKIGGLFIA